jgi:hypothetical protein
VNYRDCCGSWFREIDWIGIEVSSERCSETVVDIDEWGMEDGGLKAMAIQRVNFLFGVTFWVECEVRNDRFEGSRFEG